MPRDATATRERLLRAAERRFAVDGVAGARMSDVVRDAGQANDAAVSYHFGSRDGLLREVVDRHVSAMEAVRARQATAGETAGLHDLIRAIVVPTAALLGTAEGRDFLRIVEQLAGFSGVRRGRIAAPIEGSVLATQLARLEELVAATHGRPIARERVGALVTFLSAGLAERARFLETGRRPALGHARYVEQLVAMLAGAMEG
ncbi:MAG: TetR family transcriptional regulator [Marmoricola sp.]